MNTKLLSVVTPLFIYNVYSTWKTLYERNFSLGEFTPLNMKYFGRRNVRKHIEIKDSDNYTTLDISLKFGSLEKMRITYSEDQERVWLPISHYAEDRKSVVTKAVPI